jgi:3-deoxy-7-phosphoheptulonate synthase
MILSLTSNATEKDAQQLLQRLEMMGFKVTLNQNDGRFSLAIVSGIDKRTRIDQFATLPFVEQILPVMKTTDDLRIRSLNPLISPALLMHEIPTTPDAIDTIIQAREAASRIMNYADNRLLVIVGPCSIHDVDGALEYAARLKKLIDQHQNELCIVMRIYFEKPRTTVGWKGLINDPYLDNSFQINQGLKLARKLLLDLAEMGVPSATEFLDTIVPQFISDLVAWGAIGARTTECQLHRELASGLSMPVGFKNGTNGNVQIAIDALLSAQHPHHFLSVTKHGVPAIVSTLGNDSCHVILRGSSGGTNYSAAQIAEVEEMQKAAQIHKRIMVDCSHGNSQKDHRKQSNVIHDLAAQLNNGSQMLGGVMLESNLVEGKQALIPGKKLVYGQSITDACIAWEETVVLLEELAQAVKMRNKL